MEKYMKGKLLKGVVTGIEPYGVFVQFDDYYSGLIHISELSNNYVKDPNDIVHVGDIITAKIIDVDDKLGHLKLSIKNISYFSILSIIISNLDFSSPFSTIFS